MKPSGITKIIEEKFKRQIVRIEAGELLFKHADVWMVIDEIEREHAVILGLDFWEKCGDGDVREKNSTAWDDINTGISASKATVKEARQLLKNGLLDDADYVSFVLNDK